MNIFRTFYLLPLLWIYSSVNAQEIPLYGEDSTVFWQPANHISVNLTPEAEFYFYYERIFDNKHGIEVALGYRGETADTGSTRTNGIFSFTENKAWWYSGPVFGLAYRHYFKWGNHPGYFSLSGLYKYYNFPEKTIYYVGDDIFRRKSGLKQVLLVKALFGKKWIFPISERASGNIDLFFGIGLREKTFNDVIFAVSDPVTEELVYLDTPEDEIWNEVIPSVHFGVKLGFGL